jgi:hypothetical protein
MDTDTVTIELPAQSYAQLQALAADEQTDPVELLVHLIATAMEQRIQPQSPTRAFQRIRERATDFGVTDLAEQHDHHLYGLDKQ